MFVRVNFKCNFFKHPKYLKRVEVIPISVENLFLYTLFLEIHSFRIQTFSTTMLFGIENNCIIKCKKKGKFGS